MSPLIHATLCLTLALGVYGCRKADPSTHRTTPLRQRSPAPSPSNGPPQVVPLTLSGTTTLARDSFKSLRVGAPTTIEKLTVYPLYASSQALPYLPLTIDDAFKRKLMTVSEQGSASVPTIKVVKHTTERIFIMTGELFAGAKQDRISKHDVLLSAQTGVYKLPVYCVEAGRWRGTTHRFGTANLMGSTRVRRTVAKKMGQSQVWSRVRAKNVQVGAQTTTQTLLASYASHAYKQNGPRYLKQLANFAAANPGSRGVVAVIDGHLVSADLFGHRALFVKLWPKMLKALVLDAVDPNFRGSPAGKIAPVKFLAQLGQAAFRKSETPSLGQELLISGKQIAGTLFADGPHLVHLSLFPDRGGRIFRRSGALRQNGPQQRFRNILPNNLAPKTQQRLINNDVKQQNKR